MNPQTNNYMEKQKHLLMHLILSAICLLTLTGCEEDWWDARHTDVFGDWRIVEVTGSYNCNYRPGDYWTFYTNGGFMAQGYDGLYESGSWDRRGRELYIYFNSYNPEIVAYVRSIDDDYMVLDIDDYTYQSSYTLRLVRQSYYSQHK